MHNKYCENHYPNEVIWKLETGSQVWKKMLKARDLIEHQILWKLKDRKSSPWFDN